MRRFALLVVPLALAGACAEPMTSRRVEIDGVTYQIPTEQVEARVQPPDGEPYARIRAPQGHFKLVARAQDRIRRNWQGEGTQLVAGINDVPSQRFESYEFPEGKTVCRGDIPLWNCGLRVQDGSIGWSVIFGRDQVPNSRAIRTAALQLISSYTGRTEE
jgi:hypothetical protein